MTTDRRARLPGLFDLLSASSPEGSGALHVGAPQDGGVVLFDLGRVCWAASRGVGRRLTDLVCDAGGVPRAVVEAAYAECRARGARFGETLVERQLVNPHQLRALLLQHTAEVLISLADRVDDPVDDPVWIPHRGGGYQPRFTFTVSEVIAAATAACLDVDASAARLELEAVVADTGLGAAFDLDGDPLPIAVIDHAHDLDGDHDHALLRTLGGWVAEVTATWPAGAPRFVSADAGRHTGSLVAWRADNLTCGARITGGSGLTRVLAYLMRRT